MMIEATSLIKGRRSVRSDNAHVRIAGDDRTQTLYDIYCL